MRRYQCHQNRGHETCGAFSSYEWMINAYKIEFKNLEKTDEMGHLCVQDRMILRWI